MSGRYLLIEAGEGDEELERYLKSRCIRYTRTDGDDPKSAGTTVGQHRDDDENELFLSYSLLETIFEGSPLLIAYMDARFNFLRVNNAYAAADHLVPEDFVGRNHFDMYPDDENEIIFQNVVKTGEPHYEVARPFQYEYNRERGITYWDWSLTPILDAWKRVQGLLLVLLNVTERVTMEYERQRLAVVVDQAPVSIVITDMKGSIQYVNPFFIETTGFQMEELIGENPRILKSGAQSRDVYDDLWSTISSGNVWNKRLIDKKKNGERYYEQSTIFPIKNNNGEILSYAAVKRDITEQVEKEEELEEYKNHLEILIRERTLSLDQINQELNQEIEERKKTERALREAEIGAMESNRAKSMFLANMSHELRTPLNAILGFAGLIQRDMDLQQKHKEKLQMINRSGEHLLAIINDVLEVSRIEAGRVRAVPRVINVIRLVKDLEEMFRLRTDVRGVALYTKFYGNIAEYIETDEGKLRQILINIIGNAVKFTEQGSIRLAVDVVQNRNPWLLKFTVTDTGPGIAYEDQPYIFRPFEQTSLGQEKGGSGLGLMIAREYAILLGGDITATSIPEKGSEFVLQIRYVPVDHYEEEVEKTNRFVQNIKKDIPPPVLLVIEDDISNRNYLVELLSSTGFRVLSAENGEEGLEVFIRNKIDLVLLDLKMPIMGGEQFIREMKSTVKGKRVPVIVVSAHAFEENRQAVLDLGADDFLRKPVSDQDLFDKLAVYLPVEYNYATDENDENELREFSGEDSVSNELYEELIQAAMSADTGRMSELVEQLNRSAPVAAKMIRQYSRDFHWERVISYIEEMQRKS